MSHIAQISSAAAKAADRPGCDLLWHPRFMPCAVCLRPARGFGFFNPNTPRPREHTWFCSMPCQLFFAMRFKKELTMIGITNEERLAIAVAVKNLGRMMEEIGWEKRLCELTESEVTALIEDVLESYSEQMSRIAKSQQVPF